MQPLEVDVSDPNAVAAGEALGAVIGAVVGLNHRIDEVYIDAHPLVAGV